MFLVYFLDVQNRRVVVKLNKENGEKTMVFEDTHTTMRPENKSHLSVQSLPYSISYMAKRSETNLLVKILIFNICTHGNKIGTIIRFLHHQLSANMWSSLCNQYQCGRSCANARTEFAKKSGHSLLKTIYIKKQCPNVFANTRENYVFVTILVLRAIITSFVWNCRIHYNV